MKERKKKERKKKKEKKKERTQYINIRNKE